jgi:hypothetical protein
MTFQNSTTITIAWSTPDNGGTPITTYSILSDSASNGATFTTLVASTGVVNSLTITGLTADSVYQFKVQATNVIGLGDLSAASAGIRAAAVPYAPGIPTKVSASTSSISISWTVPTFDGGSAITNYYVYISPTASTSYTLL